MFAVPERRVAQQQSQLDCGDAIESTVSSFVHTDAELQDIERVTGIAEQDLSFLLLHGQIDLRLQYIFSQIRLPHKMRTSIPTIKRIMVMNGSRGMTPTIYLEM